MEIEEAKRRARKGPLLLLARRVCGIAITIASTLTVARLVGPRVYGLANMSAVLLAFAQIFRDFGLTNALLRKGDISQGELSFIFWFNVATTTLLASVLALASSAISDFYHEPIVQWVVLVALIGFLLEGWTLQHRALINRELRFGTIALLESLSLLAGFVVSLTLAAIYHNVWAIVVGNVAQSVTIAVGCLAASDWRPGRPRWLPEFGEVLRFGANASVFTISVFLSDNVASILVGRLLGAGSLGFYNRATALFQLPVGNIIDPITHATTPLLLQLRGHRDEYRAAYLSLVRKLSAFVVPGSVIIAFCAVPLVETMLGPRWREAGFVLGAMMPALAGYSLSYAAADLFITQDRAAELRWLGIVEAVVRIGAVLAGVRFGLVQAALCFTAAALATAVLRVIVVGRTGPVSRRDQVRAVLPAVPLGLGAALGAGCAKTISLNWAMLPITAAPLIFSLGALGAVSLALPFAPTRSMLFELLRTFVPARLRGAEPAMTTT